MWNSMLLTLPSHKLGVVLLSNSEEAGNDNLLIRIAVTILEQALKVKAGIERPAAEPRLSFRCQRMNCAATRSIHDGPWLDEHPVRRGRPVCGRSGSILKLLRMEKGVSLLREFPQAMRKCPSRR